MYTKILIRPNKYNFLINTKKYFLNKTIWNTLNFKYRCQTVGCL